MTTPSDMLARLTSPELAKEVTENLRQAGFEERVVKAILRYANVPLHVGRSHAEALRDTGDATLGIAWFHNQFPMFPIHLLTSKMRNTSGTKIGWTALFGRGFARLPWFVEYVKMAEHYGWSLISERVALVFNAPHADKSATMVLHNQPIQATIVEDPERRDETETRIIRPYGHPRITFVVESFKSFMQTVGTDWASDACQSH